MGYDPHFVMGVGTILRLGCVLQLEYHREGGGEVSHNCIDCWVAWLGDRSRVGETGPCQLACMSLSRPNTLRQYGDMEVH